MLPIPKTYLILKTGLMPITYQIDGGEIPEKPHFMIFPSYGVKTLDISL